mgnify:CR=1
MTCPLNRCDGSGWTVYDRETSTYGLKPCPCHGWRRIDRGAEPIGSVYVWTAYAPSAVSLAYCESGTWRGSLTTLPLRPQPTHYHPRPLPPEVE